MAFVALLQHAETVRHEIVRVIGRVVARITDSEGAARVHGDPGRRRTRNFRRHRGRRWRLAELLDAHQNVLLMELILYTHILQQTRASSHVDSCQKNTSKSKISVYVFRDLCIVLCN